MNLFKRFPKIRLSLKKMQHIIAPDERAQYPAFLEDFATLEKELMPSFRRYDNEALLSQNSYRWMYVALIIGSAVSTLIGILQLTIEQEIVGIIGAVVGALLVLVTLLLRSFHYQEHYQNARLIAEMLRAEYFLFLGHLDRYKDEHNRVTRLKQRVVEIRVKGEGHASV